MFLLPLVARITGHIMALHLTAAGMKPRSDDAGGNPSTTRLPGRRPLWSPESPLAVRLLGSDGVVGRCISAPDAVSRLMGDSKT